MGLVVLLLLVGVPSFWWWRRRRNKRLLSGTVAVRPVFSVEPPARRMNPRGRERL